MADTPAPWDLDVAGDAAPAMAQPAGSAQATSAPWDLDAVDTPAAAAAPGGIPVPSRTLTDNPVVRGANATADLVGTGVTNLAKSTWNSLQNLSDDIGLPSGPRAKPSELNEDTKTVLKESGVDDAIDRVKKNLEPITAPIKKADEAAGAALYNANPAIYRGVKKGEEIAGDVANVAPLGGLAHGLTGAAEDVSKMSNIAADATPRARGVEEGPRPPSEGDSGFTAADFRKAKEDVKPTADEAPKVQPVKVDAQKPADAKVEAERPVPPNANLKSPEERDVETRHYARTGVHEADDGSIVVHNPEAYAQAKKDYAAIPDTDGGKVLNTDEARKLSPDYNVSDESRSSLSAAVHEPSSAFIKQVYADRLKEAKPGDTVLFTGGGTGAGKSSTLKSSGLGDTSSVIYDTNMNKLGSATQKIDQALDAGQKVQLAYTYRDPVDALVNGALPRAERTGRTVPIKEHAATHEGGYDTLLALQDKYKDNPNVDIKLFDNSHGKGGIREVPIDDAAGLRDNKPWPTKGDYAEAVKTAGKDFSPRVINGTFGETSGEAKEILNGRQGNPTSSEAGNAVQPGGARSAASSGADQGAPPKGASAGAGESVRDVREGGPGGAQSGLGEKGNAGPANSGSGGGAGARPGQRLTDDAPKGRDERAAILKRVGFGEARESALTGDHLASAGDYQTSKLDNKAGARMDSVLASERSTLGDHAQRIVDRSGGTNGLDEGSRYARGHTISDVFNKFDDILEQETKEHYKTADTRAAGQPIELNGIKDFVKNNKASFLSTVEGKQLLEGFNARADELGLTKGSDVFNPSTVAQAERLRQYLGDAWTPRTARLVSKLQDAIDEDVSKAAGADVYGAARQVRAERAALREAKGLDSVMDPSRGLDINRKVAMEKVPVHITKMPVDQFGHLMDTLESIGGREGDHNLAELAASAKNEIRAQFANEIKEAGESTKGMWNAKAVSQYIKNNSSKLERVFTKPGEMKSIKDLSDAGRILDIDRQYPGAAAQQHNLLVRGVLKGVEKGSTLAGAHAGGLPGAIIGHGAAKVAEKIDEGALMGGVNKRITKL